MNFANMTSAHFIFIPAVLLVGIVIGWVLGSRAAQDAFAAELQEGEEREKRNRPSAAGTEAGSQRLNPLQPSRSERQPVREAGRQARRRGCAAALSRPGTGFVGASVLAPRRRRSPIRRAGIAVTRLADRPGVHQILHARLERQRRSRGSFGPTPSNDSSFARNTTGRCVCPKRHSGRVAASSARSASSPSKM